MVIDVEQKTNSKERQGTRVVHMQRT